MKFKYFQIERQWSFADTLLLSWGPPVIQICLLKRKCQTSTLSHIRQHFLTVHIQLHETPLTVVTVYRNKPSQYKTQWVHSNSLPKHCRTYWQFKVLSMPFWTAQGHEDSTHSPSWVLLMKSHQTSHAQGVCNYFALLLDIRMKIFWKGKIKHLSTWTSF